MNNEQTRIVELLNKKVSSSAYSLFSADHPLKIYLGVNDDGKKSLVVISDSERIEVIPSKLIDVKYERHSDNSLSLAFNLLDENYTELFYSFCADVIKNTYNCDTSEGFLPVVKRYEAWQNFFKRDNRFLSESEIKGLIGELLFIERRLLPEYGADKAIDAYIGIENGHKDFELGETWHEIKAVHNGASSVNISSLEQLDSERVGYLEIITLDEGAMSEEAINLNRLVESVRGMLAGNALLKFDNKLLEKGYLNDEYYDTYSYIPISAISYRVSGEFPRLTKGNIPNGIISAKYELDLATIRDYKELVWI